MDTQIWTARRCKCREWKRTGFGLRSNDAARRQVLHVLGRLFQPDCKIRPSECLSGRGNGGPNVSIVRACQPDPRPARHSRHGAPGGVGELGAGSGDYRVGRAKSGAQGGRYRVSGQENEAEIRKLTTAIRSKRSQREKWIVKQYHENYFYHRPT